MTQYLNYRTNPIAFTDKGHGFPLILLHGFCEDKSIWSDYQTPFLEQGYRVITIDLPGFGGSGLIEDITISGMSDAVHAVLQHLIPQVPFVLIGHSMGGYVTLAYAEKYPEFLAGISLFHSHPFADSDSKKENRQKSVSIIKQIGVGRFVKQLIPGLFDPTFRETNKDVIDLLVKIGSQQTEKGIIAAQLAMKNRPDQSKVLEALQVPTLFIIGKKDNAVPYELSLAQSHLPDRSIIKALDIGHMGMYEAKEETQEAIIAFTKYIANQRSDN